MGITSCGDMMVVFWIALENIYTKAVRNVHLGTKTSSCTMNLHTVLTQEQK